MFMPKRVAIFNLPTPSIMQIFTAYNRRTPGDAIKAAKYVGVLHIIKY